MNRVLKLAGVVYVTALLAALATPVWLPALLIAGAR